jgi:NAD(P)-dependent dehydrogenase (short-subunit alcohol dehydrogenase family)
VELSSRNLNKESQGSIGRAPRQAAAFPVPRPLVSRARNIGTNDVDAARQIALSTHPIGRLGTPADIAKGILFLASDDAGFMTGAGLVVDGGLTAQ